MRKMFFERALAQEWLQQNANTTGEIPHAGDDRLVPKPPR